MPYVKRRKKQNIEVGDYLMKLEWIRCPVCGNKTRNRIRIDTILVNYPLFCPKCKQETLISINNLKMLIIKEPDAQTQSR